MNSNIKIGADELILWLRKNNKRADDSNIKLGKNIHDLIVDQLDGKLIEGDKPCVWDMNNEEIVNELFLPKTAAQYSLRVDAISRLYTILLEW